MGVDGPRAQKTLPALLRSYGLSGIVPLCLDLLSTKLRFPGARIVRRPVFVRGKRWISIGRGFTSGRGLRLEALGSEAQTALIIRIGKGVQVNDYVHIAGIQSVEIGDRVLIASRVFITDHNHGSYGDNGQHCDPMTPPARRPLCAVPVVIEEDVWIGESVSVLPGVTIGRGSIIGCNSVVTRSIPAASIAVGSPARVVKVFDAELRQWRKA
jgi:lipopolysaccharide O-acetyltransferase